MTEEITQSVALGSIVSIGLVFVGIVISIFLPVAVKTLQNARDGLEDKSAKPNLWQKIGEAWKKYGGPKYLRVVVAGTFVATALVLLLELKFYTSRDAVLAGFAWESLINKLFGQSKQSDDKTP